MTSLAGMQFGTIATTDEDGPMTVLALGVTDKGLPPACPVVVLRDDSTDPDLERWPVGSIQYPLVGFDGWTVLDA